MNLNLLIAAISCLLVGIVLILVLGYMSKLWRKRQERCTGKTLGTVMKVIEEMDSTGFDNHNKFVHWYAIVTFEVAGKSYEIKTAKTLGSAKLQERQQVTVMYNPAQPYDCFIKEVNGAKATKTYQKVGWALLATGAIFLLLSFIF